MTALGGWGAECMLCWPLATVLSVVDFILQFSAPAQATENEGYKVMRPSWGTEGGDADLDTCRDLPGHIPGKASPAVTGSTGVSYLQSEPKFIEDVLCIYGVWQSYFIQCSENTARQYPRYSKKRKPQRI